VDVHLGQDLEDPSDAAGAKWAVSSQATLILSQLPPSEDVRRLGISSLPLSNQTGCLEERLLTELRF
jgi:hypothetical protein